MEVIGWHLGGDLAMEMEQLEWKGSGAGTGLRDLEQDLGGSQT